MNLGLGRATFSVAQIQGFLIYLHTGSQLPFRRVLCFAPFQGFPKVT